jgi:hypothetical protein
MGWRERDSFYTGQVYAISLRDLLAVTTHSILRMSMYSVVSTLPYRWVHNHNMDGCHEQQWNTLTCTLLRVRFKYWETFGKAVLVRHTVSSKIDSTGKRRD